MPAAVANRKLSKKMVNTAATLLLGVSLLALGSTGVTAQVAARAATRADGARLALDLPGSPKFTATKDGEKLVLRFDQPLPGPVPAGVVARIGSYLGPADLSGDRRTVTFALRRPVTVRSFTLRNTAVIDLVDGAPAAAPVAAKPPAPPETPAPARAAPTRAEPTRPEPTRTITTIPAPVAPPPVPARPPVAGVAAATAGVAAIATAAAAPVESLVSPVAGGANPPLPPRAVIAEPAPSVVVIPLQARDGATIKLPFEKPPAAAVFQRGSSLYVVFDRAANFDFAALRKTRLKVGDVRLGDVRLADGRSTDPEQIAVSDGSAFVMPIPPGIGVAVAKEKDGWALNFRNGAQRPQILLPVTSEQSPDGPRLRVNVENATPALSLTDRESGDAIRVVPVATGGRGVEAERKFAQFTLLASAQGVAVGGLADGVDLKVGRAAVEVMAIGGLKLSPLVRGLTGPLFDFTPWLNSAVPLNEMRQQLVAQVAATAEGSRERTMQQVQLAQFFMARDFGSDALGVLDLMVAGDRSLANDPGIKALRGAAKVIIGDFDGAEEDLADPRLQREPELSLWRAAALAGQKKYFAADPLFRFAAAVPQALAPETKRRLALLDVETAIIAKDLPRGRQRVAELTALDTEGRMRDRLELLSARLRMAEGDRGSNRSVLNRLSTSQDAFVAAFSEYLLVDMALAETDPAQKITLKDAISRLERVRSSWNGDDLEYDILKKLADLYSQDGDVRNALRVMREATTAFPSKPDSAALRERMVELFAAVYVDGRFEAMPPLTALSLYDSNRDLTPQGARGDAMIQKLADRLVQLDLLDRAGELLDHQMRNRLAGVDRARVGARLAVVNLLDRNWTAALVALDFSHQSDLPPELSAERKRLRAQALMQMGDTSAALVAIEGDATRAGELLRAEIFRRALNWAQAAETYRRIVGSPRPGTIDAPRQVDLLNLAITLAMAGNDAGLAQLRAEFGAQMEATPHKETFGMITAPAGGPAQTANFRNLTQQLADLDKFQSYLGSYRERVRSGGLAVIN